MTSARRFERPIVASEALWPVVLFDLDGTVIDSFDGIADSVRAAYGLIEEPLPSDEEVRSWIGPPLAETFFAKLSHRGSGTIEEALAEFRRVYLGGAALTATLYEGMDSIISELRKAGVWVGLVTLKGRPISIEISAHLGFGEHLHEVFGPIPGEPAPSMEAMVREALVMAGESSGVMVGDRANDIRAARGCGIDAVGVAWGFGSRDSLEEAGASIVADSPTDLAQVLGVERLLSESE